MPDQKTTAQRLDDIEAKLDRLVTLAEQAEKFLHDPIGSYKRARLGKLPRDGTAA